MTAYLIMSFQPWQVKELEELRKEERTEYAEWYRANSVDHQHCTKKRPASNELVHACPKHPRLDRPRDKSI